MTRGRSCSTNFLWCPRHGVMGTSVHRSWEPSHTRWTCMTDWWAWSPLAVRVTSGDQGGEPSATLGMSCTIPGMVHEWPLPHSLSGISSRVPDTGPLTQPFHRLYQVRAVVPFLASVLPASLASLLEMAHDDECGKRPQSEGSSFSSQSPPPCQMVMAVSFDWVSMTTR
jgi:hypothetical protein